MKVFPAITGALCANSHPGSYTGQDAFNNMLPVIEKNSYESQEDKPMVYDGENITSPYNRQNPIPDGPAPTLDTDSRKYVTGKKYVLRRLTPVECARLQGFPDWWCDGANGSDSAQYKLWGNGLALPCACDCLGRIAEELRNHG